MLRFILMSDPIGTAIAPHSTPSRKKHVDTAAALSSVLVSMKTDCTPSSKLLQVYSTLQSQYMQEGITQHSQLLLRKIGLKYLGKERITGREAVVEVVKVSKTLMMNELEIVGWSIYLTRLSGDLTPLDTHLTFSGVAAKYYFDDDIQVVQAFLEKTIPSFSHCYNEWFRAHRESMRISPKELNQRFKELSEVEIDCEPKVMQDYNFLVEEILQFNPTHAPPDPIRFTPIVLSHTKPEPTPLKPESLPANPDSLAEDEALPLDDLKLMRNSSTGSMSDFQSYPTLDRLGSIGDICPGFWDKGRAFDADKNK